MVYGMKPWLQECFGRYGYGAGWHLDDDDRTEQEECANCPLNGGYGICHVCPEHKKPLSSCQACQLKDSCHESTDRQSEADYPEEAANYLDLVNQLIFHRGLSEDGARHRAHQMLASHGMMDAYSYVIHENVELGQKARRAWEKRN
jgi:hypothetical protein